MCYDKRSGYFYLTDQNTKMIYKIDRSGKVILTYTLPQGCNKLALDSQGNIYACGSLGPYVYKVSVSGVTTINTGASYQLKDIKCDSKDNAWILSVDSLYKIAVGSNTSVKRASLNSTSYPAIELCLDSKDNMIITLSGLDYLYLYNDSNPGYTTSLSFSYGAQGFYSCVDPYDNFYVSMPMNTTSTALSYVARVKISTSEITYATTPFSSPQKVAYDNGFVFALSNTGISKISVSTLSCSGIACYSNSNYFAVSGPEDAINPPLNPYYYPQSMMDISYPLG
jgi:hypothetical protein